MPNNYEQEVCNILKETTIHQRLEELKERTNSTGHEHAFGVCSDGNVTKIFRGGMHKVDTDDVAERCNNETDLIIHSHPHFYAYPSRGDFVADLYNQPRIANCVYGSEDDKVTCYRTSDELRNKYRPLIKNAYNKAMKTYINMKIATDPEEQRRLREEYENEYNKYKTLLTNSAEEVVSNIYPNLKSITYPYGKESDDYYKAISEEPRFGNFGDVWVKDCGKI